LSICYFIVTIKFISNQCHIEILISHVSFLYFIIAQTVLRSKTNNQQLPVTIDNNNSNTTALKKKNTLTRTFSATFESNTNNNTTKDGNETSDTLNVITTSPESRRRSLTKRGAVKNRLYVHRDEPSSNETSENTPKKTATSQKLSSTTSIRTSTPVEPVLASVETASTPIESTSTLLSIERSIESDDKVVVGPADTQNKRRAIANDEEFAEIEYCPPPVKGMFFCSFIFHRH
jgi:hypothetical protein